MALDPAIQLLLDEMKKEYAAELPVRVDTLRKAWQELLEQPSKSAQQAYHRLIHDLHGSAGTFGFEEISEAAAACETEFLALLEVDAVPIATAHLQDLTEHLCTIMSDAYGKIWA